jgi:thymidine kinase
MASHQAIGERPDEEMVGKPFHHVGKRRLCPLRTVNAGGEPQGRHHAESRKEHADQERHVDPDELVQLCQEMADRGQRVIVAGLDQNYRAEPFPAMMQLMALAESVDKLYAICVRCGAYATRSQRLIDGQPAPRNAPTIAVGGLELYEARCRACYQPAL